MYQGEIYLGQRNGTGTYQDHKYKIEGTWIQDKLDGTAKIISQETMLTGIFCNGKLLKGSLACNSTK